MKRNFGNFFILFLVLLSGSMYGQLTSLSIITYDESTKVFRLTREPDLIPYGTDVRNKPYWTYFWEFGDGHFSEEISPEHYYSRPGTYQVSLHLSPRYALNSPKEISLRLTVSGGRPDSLKYELQGKHINLTLSTPNTVVPGQKINMALMYGNGSSESTIENGYLFFFFNQHKEVPVSYKRFSVVDDIRTFRDGPAESSVFQLVENITSSGIRKAITSEVNNYENTVAFKIDELGAEEQRNIFLTMMVDQRLIGMQNRDRKLSITAIFVPESGEFYRDRHRIEKELVILSVHDPNRIEVDEEVLYFHNKVERKLTYTIDYQNKEGGSVNDVTLKIPIDRGLDLESASVRSLDPYLPACPSGLVPDTLSCMDFQKIEGADGDSVKVILHNIGLAGKKSIQQKRASKGQVQLNISSDSRTTPQNNTFAEIYFDQVAPIRTNMATTSWRRRSVFLRPQFEMGLISDVFNFDPQEAIDRFGGGFAIMDAPLGKGLAYGLEATYTSLSFSRHQNYFEDDILKQRREFTRLQLIDLNFLLGYQPRGNIRLSTGLGGSFPLMGRTKLLELTEDISSVAPSFITTQSIEADYGLLKSGNNDNPAMFPDPIPQSLGIYWRVALEVGSLDKLSIGISHDYRYFPKLYYDACGHMQTYALFLRMRLFDSKLID